MSKLTSPQKNTIQDEMNGCFCQQKNENSLLSTDGNIVFRQILSCIPLLRPVVAKICELSPAPSAEITFWGETNFQQALDHLTRLENYIFSISKTNVFHSTPVHMSSLSHIKSHGLSASQLELRCHNQCF